MRDPNGHLENKRILAQSSRVLNTQKGGYEKEGANSSPGKCLSLNKNPTCLLGDDGLVIRVKIQILSPFPLPWQEMMSPCLELPQHFLSLFYSLPAFILSLFLSSSLQRAGTMLYLPWLPPWCPLTGLGT